MKHVIALILVAISLISPRPSPAETPSATKPSAAAVSQAEIDWQPFSEKIFERAAKENKLILMDVEAVWCHWCHVMEKETYSRPEIREQIAKHFIAVRVDQDARPDISTRYQDYGWPATIVLSADGKDLVKRAGFIRPAKMLEMLSEVVRNPVPHEDEDEALSDAAESKNAADAKMAVSAILTEKLIKNHERLFDLKVGGLDFSHRFLIGDSVEYSIFRASAGEKLYETFARTTLTAAIKLIDPVWGGVYQYSTDRDWDHPHFEKIVPSQAINMRSYAHGYAQFGDPKYLEAAQSIRTYIKNFLTSPEGGFYTSQDADLVRGVHSADYFSLNDTERRKRGIPRVDQNRYSYENGLIISALVALYSASGDRSALSDAERAARWIIENRGLATGGFSHDQHDQGGPYLRDSLAMSQALLNLYSATGNREYLTRSVESARFILDNFTQNDRSGLASYSPKTAGILKPPTLQEENIPAARLLNLLGHYSGEQQFREQAQKILAWLGSPKIALQSSTEVGILLADQELRSAPIHLTIVGHKDDPRSQALITAALRIPVNYKRIDWWDKREGPLPNADVEYPELDKPAAFVCTAKRCSLPIFSPEGIAKALAPKPSKADASPKNWIGSLADAQKAAKDQKRIAMVDLYADWCAACKEFDAKTFSDPAVQKKLDRLVTARINFTEIGEAQELIQERYEVTGLPTILFLSPDGVEIPGSRITEFKSAKDFVDHLNKFAL